MYLHTESFNFQVTFTAEVTVTECPKDRKQWKQGFSIYPAGLAERLYIELDIICECECEKPGFEVCAYVCVWERERERECVWIVVCFRHGNWPWIRGFLLEKKKCPPPKIKQSAEKKFSWKKIPPSIFLWEATPYMHRFAHAKVKNWQNWKMQGCFMQLLRPVFVKQLQLQGAQAPTFQLTFPFLIPMPDVYLLCFLLSVQDKKTNLVICCLLMFFFFFATSLKSAQQFSLFLL